MIRLLIRIFFSCNLDKLSNAFLYIVLKNKYESKFVYFTIICGIIISILCLKYYLKQDEYYYAIEKNNQDNVDMSSMKYLKYFESDNTEDN